MNSILELFASNSILPIITNLVDLAGKVTNDEIEFCAPTEIKPERKIFLGICTYEERVLWTIYSKLESDQKKYSNIKCIPMYVPDTYFLDAVYSLFLSSVYQRLNTEHDFSHYKEISFYKGWIIAGVKK